MGGVGAVAGSVASTIALFFVCKQLVAPALIITVLIFLGALCYAAEKIYKLLIGLVKAVFKVIVTLLNPLNILKLVSALVISPVVIPIRKLLRKLLTRKTPDVAPVALPVIKQPVAAKPQVVAKPQVRVSKDQVTTPWVAYPGVKKDLLELDSMLSAGTLSLFKERGVGFNAKTITRCSAKDCAQLSLRAAVLKTSSGEPLGLFMDPEIYQPFMLIILKELASREYNEAAEFLSITQLHLLNVTNCSKLGNEIIKSIPNWMVVLYATALRLSGDHTVFLYDPQSDSYDKTRREFMSAGVL